MKGVQCYELFGGVTLMNHAFYLFIFSAQGDEAKTVEFAPIGFDLKSFPRQSQSCGGGIATVSKSTLGSNITFKTNFDFTHT